MRREKIITVTCNECKETFDENLITDPEVSIESNDVGQDVVYFVCPLCNQDTSSLRRG